MSLIVKNYLNSLVLVTKTFTGDFSIYILRKRKFWTGRVDYSGFGIKIILFEWTKQVTKDFLSTDDRKTPCFLTQQTNCDLLATSVVRYWIYSKFSRILHSSLNIKWNSFCFVKESMKYLSVTLWVIIGGCAVPFSVSQSDVLLKMHCLAFITDNQTFCYLCVQ